MAIEDDIKQSKFKSVHNKLIVNLMYTNNWLFNSQYRVLRPYGLTIQQYNVLRILRGQHPKPVRINNIIERMMDKMSNASRLVERLLQKELVERTECAIDRRAVNVVINQSGMDLLAKIDVKQSQWEKGFHTLSNAEAKQMSDLLDKLRS